MYMKPLKNSKDFVESISLLPTLLYDYIYDENTRTLILLRRPVSSETLEHAFLGNMSTCRWAWLDEVILLAVITYKALRDREQLSDNDAAQRRARAD